MAITLAHSQDFVGNPLDLVEDILLGSGIPFKQPVPQERTAEVDGAWSPYRLWYRWEPSMDLLLYTCTIELDLPPDAQMRLYPLIMKMNEKLWLGHFELDHKEGHVRFRQNMLIESSASLTVEKLETLLDVAMAECDRCYPAIQAVLWQQKSAEEALELALFEVAGEA